MLLTLATDPLTHYTGINRAIVWAAGLMLYPIGIWMLWVSLYRTSSRTAAMSIVVGNVLWVIASLFVWLITHATAIGTVLLLGQALIVLSIAIVEYVGVRQRFEKSL